MLTHLLVEMRPKQWTKNAVIFLAFVFSINQYWKPLELSRVPILLALTALAFVLFCLVSSSVYLINDMIDLDKDRKHPTKRRRPLAAGNLTIGQAITFLIVLLVVSLPLSFLVDLTFGLVAVGYFALNLAYSMALKNMVIVDVFAIAGGFVLRAVAGAVIIDVPITPWLYVCTMLGALFLGFSKRRHELVLLNDGATQHRAILKEYTPELLEEMIAVVTSSTVMAYSLYTFTAESLPSNRAMMLTIPFVLYGVFRYLYLIHLRNEGGSPEEILLKDKPLIVDIALWLITSVAILVLFRSS